MSLPQVAFLYIFIGMLYSSYSTYTSYEDGTWARIKGSVDTVDVAHQRFAWGALFVVAFIFIAGFVVCWPLLFLFRFMMWLGHTEAEKPE